MTLRARLVLAMGALLAVALIVSGAWPPHCPEPMTGSATSFSEKSGVVTAL